MTTPTPEEWLANFDATIADLQARTARFQEDLARSGVTETARDGSLSVSVAPNGSLTGLTIEESAWRGNGAELAGRIMQLARKAQLAAAAKVAEAFAPLGADTEAMHMITGYAPPAEPVAREETGFDFLDENRRDRAKTEQPRSAAPKVEPTPRPAGDDDEFRAPRVFDEDR